MKNRNAGVIVLAVLFLFVFTCGEDEGLGFGVNGTIRFSQFGCWTLVSSQEKVFELLRLPKEFQVEGLAVSALVTPAANWISLCMVGEAVEVVSIVLDSGG